MSRCGLLLVEDSDSKIGFKRTMFGYSGTGPLNHRLLNRVLYYDKTLPPPGRPFAPDRTLPGSSLPGTPTVKLNCGAGVAVLSPVRRGLQQGLT